MDTGHDDVRGIALLAHHGPLVRVAVIGDSPVRLPAVGVDGRSRFHSARNERDQAVLRDVKDALQAGTPEAPGLPSGPVTLLPHQVELSDDLTEELLQNKVAWLGSPTQTGKTYTLMATLEKLGVERITWGVPTRAIKDSVVRDLSRLQIDNLRIGVVGSEPGTDGVSKWRESVEDIISFMRHPDPFVIVYVTKSSWKVRDAVRTTQPVDINVIDEVHEMVGRAKKKWSALQIESTYRVGATATMADVSADDQEMCQEEGWEWSSMESSGEHNYGKGIVLSPGEARKRDLAVPAQLVLTQTTSTELADWIAASPKLETMLQDKLISAFDAQTALVLAKATYAMRAQKTMFTLNTVNAASGVKKAMPLACDYLGLPPLKGYFVYGTMPQSRREQKLWEFQNDPSPAFLTQVRCVGLGIALKGLDGVAFGQPRQSPIGSLVARLEIRGLVRRRRRRGLRLSLR